MDVKELSGLNVDIAPFGQVSYWTGSDPMSLERHYLTLFHYAGGSVWVPAEDQDGRHIGVEWEYPRQFSMVVVGFADPSRMPPPESVRLQYWQRNWPPAFHGGWTAVDDPYNGQWVNTRCEIVVAQDTWTFTFDPLDITELPHAEDFAVTYRQSCRFRLLFKDGSAPEIHKIRVLSDSIWRAAKLSIEFADGSSLPTMLSAHNGYILSVERETKA
jgi:hypothetical protein